MLIDLHPEDEARLIDILTERISHPQTVERCGHPTLDIAIQDPMFREHLKRQEQLSSFDVQRIAFEAQKEQLMKRYPAGTYIAVHGCLPVLAGTDFVEVAKSLCKQYGNKPAYIGKLGEETPEFIFLELIP